MDGRAVQRRAAQRSTDTAAGCVKFRPTWADLTYRGGQRASNREPARDDQAGGCGLGTEYSVLAWAIARSTQEEGPKSLGARSLALPGSPALGRQSRFSPSQARPDPRVHACVLAVAVGTADPTADREHRPLAPSRRRRRRSAGAEQSRHFLSKKKGRRPR